MQLTELSPEEVARLRGKVKPVTEKFAKEANEAASKELFAEIEKARARVEFPPLPDAMCVGGNRRQHNHQHLAKRR